MSYIHFKKDDDLHKFQFFKYIESNKKTLYEDKSKSVANSNYLPVPELLKCLGESDHMNVGRPVTFAKEQYVFVDNYSLNRVVNFNEGDEAKFMITNNIAKQSSRMVARYTSQLPPKVKYLETLAHMLFYPFISVSTTREHSRYDFVTLSKRKHRIPINYDLQKAELKEANQIRQQLSKYLSLKEGQSEVYSEFGNSVF